MVLDHALNITKEINIFNDLIINRCYKEFFSDRALLFFSYENNCLIHLDVTAWEVIVIELEGEMHFSPLYWWDTRDEVILVTYKRELFKLSLKDKSLTEISKEELHKDAPELYRLIVDYKDVAITHFFPHEHILLSQDQEEHKLIIYNYKKHTQEWIPCFLETTHDFLYRKGMKVFIHEERLDVCYEPTTGGIVDSEELYIFGRARFLNDSKIVVLKVDQSCNYGNMLAIYDLKD